MEQIVCCWLGGDDGHSTSLADDSLGLMMMRPGDPPQLLVRMSDEMSPLLCCEKSCAAAASPPAPGCRTDRTVASAHANMYVLVGYSKKQLFTALCCWYRSKGSKRWITSPAPGGRTIVTSRIEFVSCPATTRRPHFLSGVSNDREME